MNTHENFSAPSETECERASYSYLMSLVAVIAGLPLPIINLIATGIFFMANRKGAYFVRWHCTQAFLSQASLLLVNSYGFWWTISVIFRSDVQITNEYIAYLLTALLFNIVELIATVRAAVMTRKGIHVKWWFFGNLTDKICRP